MKSLAGGALGVLVLAVAGASSCFAQTFAATPNPAASEAAQLQLLTKKIDEQNAKIDMLSQQILKLQLQIAEHRPGVMIGEGAPSSSASTTTTSASSPASSSSPSASNGNSHVVARGETLTSIARQHNISVSELQKYNHIDNPLKLQAGQTLLIPPSPIPSPSSSGE
jgi:LysM repeat protein